MKYSFGCAADFAAMRPAIRRLLAELAPDDAQRLFVALNEAVNNAYQHGCGDGVQTVEVEIRRSAAEILLRVSHDGNGIDAVDASKSLPENDLDDHGRGLAIMRFCTDSLEYDAGGRTLVMRKRLVPDPAEN